MKLLVPALAAALTLAAAPAVLAQDMGGQPAPNPPPGSDPGTQVVASPTYPGTGGGSPGVPGPEAVNPAPGATGAYVGAGKQQFYDADQRLAAVSAKLGSLPPAQRRRASAVIHDIKALEAQHLRRDGTLRDWDRENINHRLDLLIQQYPSLGG